MWEEGKSREAAESREEGGGEVRGEEKREKDGAEELREVDECVGPEGMDPVEGEVCA